MRSGPEIRQYEARSISRGEALVRSWAKLLAPIVAIISLFPSSYYLAGGDGGVFAFGKARYEGGLAGKRLNGPITSMAIQWVTNPCVGTRC